MIDIILDTNWYISSSINKNSRRRLYRLLIHPDINILYCNELMLEYEKVISRKKFKKLIHPHQAKRFMRLILPELIVVSLKSEVKVSRDPKDNYLLSLCKDGDADYLITGDPDLLVLEQMGKTKILRMSDFIKILDQI